MRKVLRLVLPAFLLLWLAGLPLPATAQPDLHSPNMQLLDNEPQSAFVNSDLAFWGDRLYAGNYGGFRIFDISNGANPTLVEDFSCPGPQNDISVWSTQGPNAPLPDLLFLSVDSVRTDTSCASTAAPGGGLNYAPGWEGVRIFDISDETNPVQVAAVPTDCGSHTHTLVPTAANDVAYLYVSSYPLSGQTNGIDADATQDPDRAPGTRDNGTECLEPEPRPDAETGDWVGNRGHNKISIIEVDLSDPAAADDFVPGPGDVGKVYPAVFEWGLPLGTRMTHINLGSRHLEFTACHDISVFVELNLAAGSCWDEGQLWDISDPGTPDFLRRIRLNEVDLIFHSVTFTWDGEVVVFEDEAGGGGDDRCRSVGDQQGRMWFTDQDLNLLGSFKIPRPQPVGEICTAHLYNYIPQTDDRDILVSAWYEGGISVADATNAAAVTEIGYYDAQANPASSDVWSSYWYNGFIYVNDIARGLDTLAFNDPRKENAVELPFFNPQTQMNTIAQTQPTCRGQEATLWGTSQNDVLEGTDGPDVIAGLGGNDTIDGLGGNDVICAGDGNDTAKGGTGNDKIFGEGGKDKLNGNAGKDRLKGGPARDRCNGGAGKDKDGGCEKIKSIP